MSYRYCIGRHTIASVMHAETIAKLIHDNPDILSEERLAFTALDIRREINSKIWNNAINNAIGCDWDVYSAILYKSSEIENPYEVIYSVDDTSKTIKITPGIVNDKFDKDYIDLIPWIKLANWLDKSCHKLLTCAWDNAEKILPDVPLFERIPRPTTAIKARSDSNSIESGCTA